MLFQIYGETAAFQLLGWLMVFVGLIVANEIARRTKWGGIACFLVLPAALTVYFISIYVGAAMGAQWALNNPTYVYMNSWFHYFKLYAAVLGCIGFMMIKYQWGIGKKEWFKVFPFLIVAANILIAVVSDFESGIKGALSPDGWWLSSENVWLYGGWWNWLNGIAGIVNIFCMTGWWGIYVSRDKKDMLWPDMIWLYIIAYDVWNFQYTYLNLPTHAWFCGLALLLAPTVANALWNNNCSPTTIINCWHCNCCGDITSRCDISTREVNCCLTNSIGDKHLLIHCIPFILTPTSAFCKIDLRTCHLMVESDIYTGCSRRNLLCLTPQEITCLIATHKTICSICGLVFGNLK